MWANDAFLRSTHFAMNSATAFHLATLLTAVLIGRPSPRAFYPWTLNTTRSLAQGPPDRARSRGHDAWHADHLSRTVAPSVIFPWRPHVLKNSRKAFDQSAVALRTQPFVPQSPDARKILTARERTPDRMLISRIFHHCIPILKFCRISTGLRNRSSILVKTYGTDVVPLATLP